jgi:RHS repeat-associated protein
VNCSEFYNSPEKLVTVYQKFARRTESYEYDAMGNRTVERILLRKEYGYTYTYYPNSNRLQSKVKQDGTERIDYAYDENGNLISKVVTKGEKVDRWEYAYDLFNQLEQVKKNGEIVSTYIYDPNGFRVEKVGGKGKIHYVPLLNGEVGYRKEFATNAEYSFIYVGIQHLARVNGVIGGRGKKFYYHNDHLGSALAVTDEKGNKVVERDFTPFGERINTDVYDDEPRDLDEDESGFTGKDWDEDVGLYYYNARWYDPEVGRFISEDSMADDPNLYGYCGQNPVNFTDPTGHFSVGFQSGWGLVGATLNAAAIISVMKL